MKTNQVLTTLILIVLFVSSTSFISLYTFAVTFIITFCLFFLSHKLFKGAPYVRTSSEDITSMINLSHIKSNEKFVDLGSGMGEIVSAFSMKCKAAYGVEIHPLLFFLSQQKVKQSNVKFFYKDLWQIDLSTYDVVALYGIPGMMPNLEAKLQKELKLGARVLSNRFIFPNWVPAKRAGSIYLYIKS